MPTDGLQALHALARALGVHTGYTDGLGRPVTVGPETLVQVCAALGAHLSGPADAAEALREHLARPAEALPPVLVAWDGALPPVPLSGAGPHRAEIRLEDGGTIPMHVSLGALRTDQQLPSGYHLLALDSAGAHHTATIIAAPVQAFRRPGTLRSWGVGAQLGALRSARSRSLADIADLESLCRWLRGLGGDVVAVLPLLPTFNGRWPEPSPYSPVSRLFWSELILDLGAAHRPTPRPATLDVTAADAEVRAALAGVPVPEEARRDEELLRYARFRGAQATLGRNWRDWPAAARGGVLAGDQVDAEEERFHLVAQSLARRQLRGLRERLEPEGLRLGLDLAVGVHPDGFDTWSRQALFSGGMSVGAPPDPGFPSGQDWGFRPLLPGASRREGHRYVAASIAHQMSIAGVLRVDHIMAWTRLYWIPQGFGLHEGAYVSYPADELFAILTLESNRHRCEVVGENLGTVPPEIGEALPRHRIPGMFVAQFRASEDPKLAAPTAAEEALVGTHDTPTLAGWLAGNDIPERVHHGLLAAAAVPAEQQERRRAAGRLAARLNASADEPAAMLDALLRWLGESPSPLVVTWLEDLWLEEVRVNLPGTPSSQRPNWQRPMRLLLEEMFADPEVGGLLRRLHRARHEGAARTDPTTEA